MQPVPQKFSTPVKNAALPKVDGTAIGKAATLLAAIALAGFGVVPTIVADRQPQTETIAPPSVDPNWLLTPEPAGLAVALEQADLFAEEIHRALIQSEAARMVSQAHSMVGDARFQDCYRRSIENCFDSIEQSIREEWLQAVDRDEKVRVLFRWQALQVARTGNVEPPAMALDGTFLQLSDKLAIERAVAMNSSVEGASRFRQIETQLDRLNNPPGSAPPDGPTDGQTSGQTGGASPDEGDSDSEEPTPTAAPDSAADSADEGVDDSTGDPDTTASPVEPDADAPAEAARESDASDDRESDDTNSDVDASTEENSTREDDRNRE